MPQLAPAPWLMAFTLLWLLLFTLLFPLVAHMNAASPARLPANMLTYNSPHWHWLWL
uniref:ATP synthase complex subunit 8 n=1 Tax=Uroplatus ebenaui TaxID=357318 RepID=A0A0A1H7G4_9SAUR|nr:ATP synthase F0 subunit 8 [Uroplatus ebenaui]BAP90313.1 ATPase subunit 8 [Uroplatus ebenaui]